MQRERMQSDCIGLADSISGKSALGNNHLAHIFPLAMCANLYQENQNILPRTFNSIKFQSRFTLELSIYAGLHRFGSPVIVMYMLLRRLLSAPTRIRT